MGYMLTFVSLLGYMLYFRCSLCAFKGHKREGTDKNGRIGKMGAMHFMGYEDGTYASFETYTNESCRQCGLEVTAKVKTSTEVGRRMYCLLLHCKFVYVGFDLLIRCCCVCRWCHFH
jgi:hypothetical protein